MARSVDCAMPPQRLQGFGAPARDERPMSVTSSAKRKEGGVGEFIKLLIHAGIIALVIRTFLFQPFNIPSGSMKATLLVGDYLFVSKYSYGYSHYSLPLSPPIFSGRIGAFSGPERGDVVVFRLPKDDTTDYIKRVIGLPGDSIQMIDGILNINGQPVPKVHMDDFVDEDENGRATRVRRWLRRYRPRAIGSCRSRARAARSRRSVWPGMASSGRSASSASCRNLSLSFIRCDCNPLTSPLAEWLDHPLTRPLQFGDLLWRNER